MSLPRFLRRWVALFLAWREEEIGGMLYDYANGRWRHLLTWNTQEGAAEALSLVQDMIDNVRDNIYVVGVRGRQTNSGFLIVHDSNCRMYVIGFYPGVYSPDEAMQDVMIRCRKVADKMGYRRPDDVNCGSAESSHCS